MFLYIYTGMLGINSFRDFIATSRNGVKFACITQICTPLGTLLNCWMLSFSTLKTH
jgi:hypothetical protein